MSCQTLWVKYLYLYICYSVCMYMCVLHMSPHTYVSDFILFFKIKVQKSYWWMWFIRGWLTWKLCRVVWTSRCNYRGWREWATGERSQNLWHFHPQPTKQYMRSHLSTAYQNTLQEKENSRFRDKRCRRTSSDYLTLQRKECSVFQKITIIKIENVCENTYSSKAWRSFVSAAG